MGCYGYCVLPCAIEPAAGLTGIDDLPVMGRGIGTLTLWLSEMARPEPGVERVKAHNDVVEKGVSEAVTPVPLRFGQWTERPADFEALIVEKSAWYEERLAKFAGALEFGLRIARPDKPPAAHVVRPGKTESGTAYMEALRARVAAEVKDRDESELVRAGVAEVMHGLLREERMDGATTPHGIVTLSHLVARPHFDEYRERVQQLRSKYPELRFLLTGPWVPYSFAA